jgi:hypothetical protein
MGVTQDIQKLQEQMKVLMELLRHPSKQASTVLYLVETIQNLERINYDYANKWNIAASYIQNKHLETEYNSWVEQIDKIESPQMKQLFMLQPIGAKPEGTPTAPELCGEKSPFHKDVTCFDKFQHDGPEHMGINKDGKMFKWAKDKDFGEVDNSSTPEVPAGLEPTDNEIPDAPSEDPEEEPEEKEEEPPEQ